MSKIEFEFLSSKDCDLRDYNLTKELFSRSKPTYVIHLAARVGGLFANMSDKVGFYQDNMLINLNVTRSCFESGVSRLLSALSTCIFPDNLTNSEET